MKFQFKIVRINADTERGTGIKVYAHDLDTNLDFAITVGEGVTKEQVIERLVERMRYFYQVIQPSELFKSLNGQVFTTPLNRTEEKKE